SALPTWRSHEGGAWCGRSKALGVAWWPWRRCPSRCARTTRTPKAWSKLTAPLCAGALDRALRGAALRAPRTPESLRTLQHRARRMRDLMARAPRVSDHNEPEAHGAGHGIRAARGAELGHDRGDVELGRVRRNFEAARDRLVRSSPCQQL